TLRAFVIPVASETSIASVIPPAADCINNPLVVLNGSISGGATTGLWTTSGSGIFDDPTLMNATYTPSSSDTIIGLVTFILTSTFNGLCNVEIDTVEISFVPAPTVNAGPDQVICANHFVPLSGVVSGGSGAGYWTTLGTGTFSDSNDLNGVYSFSIGDTTGTPKSIQLVLTTPASTGCFAVTDTFTVNITPGPYVFAGSDTSVCGNNDTVFYNSTVSGGATTGIWTTTGSGTFSPNNTALSGFYVPSDSDRTSGTVELILTSTNNGDCFPEDDTIFVNITPAPVVDAGGNQFVCNGNVALLSASITGGTTTGYWTSSGTGSFDDSTLLAATYTPSTADTIAPGPDTIVFVLTSTNNGNCLVESDTLAILLTASPFVNAGGNDTTCANTGGYVLNGTVSGSTSTGVWATSGTGSFVDSTDLNTTYIPSDSDTVAGSVILILSSTNACLIQDSLMLTITPAPIVDAGGDQIICANDTSLALNGSVIGSSNTGAFTGQWTTLGTGSFFPNTSESATYYRLSAADSLAGGTTLILTSTNNGNCSAVSDTVAVTITTIPVVDAGLDDTVCANTVLNLSGTVIGGASSGQWYTLGIDTGIFSSSDTILNPTYAFSNGDTTAGSVIIVLSSTYACLNITDTVYITITPAPKVDAILTGNVCASNDSIDIASLVQVAGGATWSSLGGGVFSPGANVLTGTDSLKYVLSATDLSSGVVTLILTSTSNGSCNTEVDTLAFNLVPAPVVNAGPDQNVCTDVNSVVLTGSVTGGSSTGQWSTSGTGTFTDNTTLTTLYIPSFADTTGSVILTLTSTNNGVCFPVTDSLMVIWSERPVVDAGLDDTICSDLAGVSLNGIITGGTSTGVWITSGTGTFSPDSATLNALYIPSAADITGGQVTLTLTATGGCAATSDNVTITINPAPIAYFTYSTGNSLTVSFTDSSTIVGGTIVQWFWDFGDASTSNIPSPTHTYATTGVYPVQLVVISDLGCIDTLLVTVSIVFIVADFNADTVCLGVTTTFTDSSSAFGLDSIIAWNWDFGDASTSTLQSPTHVYISAGSYVVTLIVTSQQGYKDTSLQVVMVYDNPTAGFSLSLSNPTILQPINFIDESIDAVLWSWDFGDGSVSSSSNPTYTYNISNVMTITQIVTNVFGCTDTIRIDKKIENIYPPAVPLAFSPNGDGENDILIVRGGPFKTVELIIYNEWGELIFTSEEMKGSWDGTKKGVPQPLGVYIYTVKATTLNDLVYDIWGEVSLLR
ncbi:MAG: hypothetical protein COB85_07180, partial [Bacteroidetes bacterium]